MLPFVYSKRGLVSVVAVVGL